MPFSPPVWVRTLHIASGTDMQVYYPQVQQMKNQRLERFINQQMVAKTQDLIDLQVGTTPSTPIVEMLGTFEIKNNQRDVLSVSFSNYAYHAMAAHGMTYIKSLTFDLQKGTDVQLKDLFKPGSDYISRISERIKHQIEEREISLIEPFTTIKPDQDFYIADKSLVIYFQLYDLTTYAFGFPMFPISVYDLQDIIDENGTLGRMAENN
ncbi:DUF3298 and DUF4163 domain-containing protein [Robertmurraya kyonggiensis]|uniref:DUF3298 and DUF4163 domain-containing protein n=1 Tax=Robertmurraya kyonggiensis TaxID=1037680 RepID=A0A4U1D9H5_9BACI|nr:DUF3298 and DUF4163 domain-containing protein [Robertmurraya kyonggiensis]TKC19199.1 DUF3298 and DUF4163 domain-containing protein [Robertmurraya kyonggiensis]